MDAFVVLPKCEKDVTENHCSECGESIVDASYLVEDAIAECDGV